jgi:nucleotidyltransferase/DNA polymerase involved in DNA repair
MDAFFAAIEQRNHPEYRNKPVIVGADPKKGKGRGVVSTCSYEAREFGVHSAMSISEAYKLCPQGIYVPPNGGLYSEVSHEIFKIFYEFTDLVEPLSIDEAFLDVTGSIKLFGSALEIAKSIKKSIYEKQELTASVGIATIKYLTKIASDLEKPDGLVIVEPDKIKEFLNALDISRMWGAGKKTIEKLRKAGINTFGDLAQFPEQILKLKYGKLGSHFYKLAHGIDDREVIQEHGVKSVSNERTFSEDVLDMEKINQTLFALSEKVAFRLRKKSLNGKTIHLKLRYKGFDTITRNKTIENFTSNTEEIYQVIKILFDNNYQSGRKVRLLGVGVSGFGNEISRQLSLFEKPTAQDEELDKLEDLVKKKFGKKSIRRAEGIRRKDII